MSAMERRKVKRYRTHGKIEIPRAFSRVPMAGIVMDVSEAGCRVCVPTGVDFDTEDLREELWLEVNFRTSYLTFRAVAAVRSLTTYPGFAEATLGLEFIDLHTRARSDIASLIRDQQEIRMAA